MIGYGILMTWRLLKKVCTMHTYCLLTEEKEDSGTVLLRVWVVYILILEANKDLGVLLLEGWFEVIWQA